MGTATTLQVKFRGCIPDSQYNLRTRVASVTLEYAGTLDNFQLVRTLAQGADAGYRYAECEIADQQFHLKRCEPGGNLWLPADMVDAIDKMSFECMKSAKSVLFETAFTCPRTRVEIPQGMQGTIESCLNGFFLVRDREYNYLWEARASELVAA